MLIDIDTPVSPNNDLGLIDDLVGYFHPNEIVADHSLSTAGKRALLAFWASDFNAVPGAPALRGSGHGVTTTIDDLERAMAQLEDGLVIEMTCRHVRG